MNKDRLIEILAEEICKRSDSFDPQAIRWKIESGKQDVHSSEALTAMTRAVEEETARLREKVVSLENELFEKENNPNYQSDLARQWVRENPE